MRDDFTVEQLVTIKEALKNSQYHLGALIDNFFYFQLITKLSKLIFEKQRNNEL